MLNSVKIVQNAYVIRNLEEACSRLHRLYRIGPFIGGSEFELSSHVYRGRPAPPIRTRAAFAQSGDLNIELVELLSDGPSAFHDMFKRDAEGFHHVAMFCEDYVGQRDAFVEAGSPVASEFVAPWGITICYVDTRNHLGHMIELYPEDATLRDLYDQSRRAAENWDGKKLILPWKP